MSEGNNNFLKGLLAGSLIGMALGILFAPKSGKRTRDYIISKADELFIKAKEEYGKVFEKRQMACEKSVNHSEAPGSKSGGVAGRGIDAVASNKGRLKMAIEAGLEAYREEINKRTAA